VVECQLPKLDVAGSTPVSRSKINNLAALKNRILANIIKRLTSLSALHRFPIGVRVTFLVG
jgi:hypothetical protein